MRIVRHWRIFSLVFFHAGRPGTVSVCGGMPDERFEKKVRTFLNLYSCNYPGYSCNPEVKGAVKEAVDRYGTGAVSAPLLSGCYDRTREREERIA